LKLRFFLSVGGVAGASPRCANAPLVRTPQVQNAIEEDYIIGDLLGK
jgi:hypothetical protein